MKPVPDRYFGGVLLMGSMSPTCSMDQTAPAHQGVLRHDRERSESANLDRRVRLRPRRHRQEAPELFREPLRNATNPEPHDVRTNADKSATGPTATGLRRASFA